MDIGELIVRGGALWSPLAFALLVGLATTLVWLAFAPARPQREVRERLDDYLDRVDLIEEVDMRRPFASRAVVPLLRRLLSALGRLSPVRNAERIEGMLVRAGDPGRLSALDFLGLQVLSALLFAGGYYWLLGRNVATSEALRNALILALLGYFLPWYWLRRRGRLRQQEIVRALPDTLDLMTVGVEAGLAFESAMLGVSERWDNALTRELRRAVTEMRMGTPRNEALQRVADRTGVQELVTFVAVLIQSSQLGVSIAQVLHTQAELMRERRRQRAEELARQAGVKMVFPLIFLIFPALIVVILGPSVPGLGSFFAMLGGVGAPQGGMVPPP